MARNVTICEPAHSVERKALVIGMAFTLQQLSDLEEIRTLKHRYFRCIDTAAAQELPELFTDDVDVDYRGGGYRVRLQGRGAMVEFLLNSFHSDAVAMHHGHMPEIWLTREEEAEGSWYLEDIFINLAERTHTIGTAIYRDRYRREAGGWRIAATQYDRVFELVQPLPDGAAITAHYLGAHGRRLADRQDISPYISWESTPAGEADQGSSAALPFTSERGGK